MEEIYCLALCPPNIRNKGLCTCLNSKIESKQVNKQNTKELMDVKTYSKIIKETAVYPDKVEDFGHAYTFMGLIGEFGEFLEVVKVYSEFPLHFSKDLLDTYSKKIKKEAGDCFWYLTATAALNGINIENVIKPSPVIEGFLSSKQERIKFGITLLSNFLTGNLPIQAEKIKKLYRDGKDLDKDDLTFFLSQASHIINIVLSSFNFSVSEVLEMNYTKLIQRRETNTLHGSGDDREEIKK